MMQIHPKEGFEPPSEYGWIHHTDAGIEVYAQGEALPPNLAALKDPPLAPPPADLLAELKAKVAAMEAKILKTEADVSALKAK